MAREHRGSVRGRNERDSSLFREIVELDGVKVRDIEAELDMVNRRCRGTVVEMDVGLAVTGMDGSGFCMRWSSGDVSSGPCLSLLTSFAASESSIRKVMWSYSLFIFTASLTHFFFLFRPLFCASVVPNSPYFFLGFGVCIFLGYIACSGFLVPAASLAHPLFPFNYCLHIV